MEEHKWKEEFDIRDVLFEPGQRGVFSDKPALIHVLGFPKRKNKNGTAVSMEIPLRIIEIKDAPSKSNPTVVIYHRDISGWISGHSYSGPYEKKEIVRAVFTLPPEMKLLVPRTKDTNSGTRRKSERR
ncbi:MAG: hypothetical protein NUV60_00180 [Patescibacteria group bacterium]|nr:hypothetical protein [Patescibacteria group bacterium]